MGVGGVLYSIWKLIPVQNGQQCLCPGWWISQRFPSALEASSFQGSPKLRCSNVSPFKSPIWIHSLVMVFFYRYDSTEQRDILVFHCEFSSKRGPDYCTKLRTKDRNVNKDVYPGLHYPEVWYLKFLQFFIKLHPFQVYLLHKGYKEFWTNHPDLCEGGYTEMDNPQFSHNLRTCRY